MAKAMSTSELSSDRDTGRHIQVLEVVGAHRILDVAERPGVAEQGPAASGWSFGPASLLDYWYILVKRRWIIAGVVGACLVIGLFATLLMTPYYRATATIEIDREPDRVVEIQTVEPTTSAQDKEFYETQYQLLRSRSLAKRVVAALNLANDPDYGGRAGGLVSTLRDALSSKPGGAPGAPPATRVSAREEAAINKVLAGLVIEPVRNSRLVRISYISPDPADAQRIANAVAENFIQQNLDRRYDASSYARSFLEERLQELKLKLEESEEKLIQYAKENQIVNLDDQQSLVSNNLEKLNESLGLVRAQRIRDERLWEQVRDATDIGLPQILNTDSLTPLRRQRAELAAEYQRKLATFKPAYPEMVQLRAQMAELDRQIEREVSLIKKAIKARYESSLAQERALASDLEQLKTELLADRDRSIQYNILKREVDTNHSLYDGLLQRYKEIGVAGGIGVNNISLIDRAQKPRSPYSPNFALNMAIALGFGLIFSVIGVLFLENLDDTLKSPEEVETRLGMTVVGIIPRIRKDADMSELLDDPRSGVSEAYRSLRTALQFSTSEGIPKSLFVTSAGPSEGKSTTATVIAKDLARLGYRVLLIDADLRNPSLHRALGLSNEAGLSNFLAGSMTRGVFQQTNVPNLTFMACGPLPPNPAELLSGDRMRSLIETCTKKLDLVVIDGPPVMGLADAPLLASMAAGTMVVMAAHEARTAAIKGALKRLQFGRARIIGAVVTKFDSSKAGRYGYSYGYGDEAAYTYGSGTKTGLLTNAENA